MPRWWYDTEALMVEGADNNTNFYSPIDAFNIKFSDSCCTILWVYKTISTNRRLVYCHMVLSR